MKILLIIFLPLVLLAEEIDFYGLKLNAGEVTTIDENTVQIYTPTEVILNKSELPNYLFNEYLKANKNINKNTLMSIITGALTDKKYNVVDAAINVYLDLNTSIDDLNYLIKNIATYKNYLAILKNQSFIRDSSLFQSLLDYELKTQPTNINLTEQEQVLLLEHLKQIFFGYLQSQDYKNVEYTIQFIKDYLQSNTESKELQNIYKNYKDGLIALNDDDLVDAQSLSNLFKFEQVSKRLDFTAQVVKILHEYVKAKINNNNFSLAFQALVLVPLNLRTPTTHNLLQEIIPKISIHDLSLLGTPEAENFVWSLARKDSVIKDLYLKILDKQAYSFLDNKQIDKIDAILSKIIILRADPNKENDKIRIKQVKIYARSGQLTIAKDIYKQIKTKVPWLEKIALYFSGLYVNKPLAFTYAALPLIILLVFAVIRAKYLQKLYKDKQYVRGRKSDSFDNDSRGSGKIFANQKLQVSPQVDEYRRGLIVLGLKPEVKIEKIKKAYRKAVKKVHPDANPNQTKKEAERFLMLTRTYERVLELHETLGYD